MMRDFVDESPCRRHRDAAGPERRPAPSPPAAALLGLQRACGNQAVASLLADRRERLFWSGVTQPGLPPHFPMGNGVAKLRSDQDAPKLEAGDGKWTVKPPKEPTWTIVVAGASDKANPHVAEGRAKVQSEKVVAGGSGAAKQLGDHLKRLTCPRVPDGEYEVGVVHLPAHQKEVAAVEAEHDADFKRAHALMSGLYTALAPIAGIGGAQGATQTAVQISATDEKDARESMRDMGDTELLEGYGDEILALPEVKLATGAVAAPSTLSEPPTVWSGLVDLVDLRERLIPVLAQEIAGQRVKRERKQGAGLDHVAARTWLVQALTAYDVAMLPPTLANAANAGELAKLCTEHWELVYRQLLDLSKQRDMQGWHSSTLTFDGFDQQLRRLLLQTCASGTFALKRDSDTFVATTNKSFGQPVVW